MTYQGEPSSHRSSSRVPRSNAAWRDPASSPAADDPCRQPPAAVQWLAPCLLQHPFIGYESGTRPILGLQQTVRGGIVAFQPPPCRRPVQPDRIAVALPGLGCICNRPAPVGATREHLMRHPHLMDHLHRDPLPLPDLRLHPANARGVGPALRKLRLHGGERSSLHVEQNSTGHQCSGPRDLPGPAPERLLPITRTASPCRESSCTLDSRVPRHFRCGSSMPYVAESRECRVRRYWAVRDWKTGPAGCKGNPIPGTTQHKDAGCLPATPALHSSLPPPCKRSSAVRYRCL